MNDFYGVLQKRFGTEAGRKRTHPTHNDIDDINEAKKRCEGFMSLSYIVNNRVVGHNLSNRRITLLVSNVIEVLRVEILEEEEPRDECGTLKSPKKKKQHLNVTDEAENLIVIKGNTDSPLSDSEDEDGFSLRESKSKSATSKKSDGIEDEDTHEEALNEKARGTDVDERKDLQRIVCEDTIKKYDYQR
ncbi:hypothetical protein CQW23_32939 [Capsicum baccatum]|uniref:Uncharacterized protein n=1 Tax=Capsicum baccatum TaxID=33114 RepID=A0A2G2V399_CAPBA|nr:hypothetical protein CQW23_32939 [Capsicum baccatum]